MNDKLDYHSKLFSFFFLMILHKFCRIEIGNLHLLLFYLPLISMPELTATRVIATIYPTNRKIHNSLKRKFSRPLSRHFQKTKVSRINRRKGNKTNQTEGASQSIHTVNKKDSLNHERKSHLNSTPSLHSCKGNNLYLLYFICLTSYERV